MVNKRAIIYGLIVQCTPVLVIKNLLEPSYESYRSLFCQHIGLLLQCNKVVNVVLFEEVCTYFIFR